MGGQDFGPRGLLHLMVSGLNHQWYYQLLWASPNLNRTPG